MEFTRDGWFDLLFEVGFFSSYCNAMELNFFLSFLICFKGMKRLVFLCGFYMFDYLRERTLFD